MQINKDFDLFSIIQKFAKHSKGLALIEIPTGAGKTFASAQYISQFIKGEATEHKKIIFLTTQKKNYPTKHIINNVGENIYKENCIVLKSNFDSIREVLSPENEKKLRKILPKDLQKEEFIKLCDALKQYNDIEQSQDYTNKGFFLETKKKEVETILKEYKRYIGKYIKTKRWLDNNKLYTKKGINYDYARQVINSTMLSWLKDLFPNVMLLEKKVMIANINIFLLPIDTIIAGKIVLSEFLYDGKNFLSDTLTFIDEFDATKDIVEKQIRDSVLNKTINARNLFNRVYSGFDLALSSTLKKALDMIKKGDDKDKKVGSYKSLKAKAKELLEKYNLNYYYKLQEDQSNNEKRFIFSDMFVFTAIDNNKYCSGIFSEKDNRVNIISYNREEKHDDAMPLISILSQIRNFLHKFYIFVKLWAEKYMELVNTNTANTAPIKDKINIDNALETILHHFDVRNDEIEFIKNNHYKYKMSNNDNTYYQEGYSIFALYDNANDNEETIFHMTKKNISPEKIIFGIANNSMIIGLSATAKLQHLKNYDIDYLQNSLGDKWYELDKYDNANIEAYINNLTNEYVRNGIEVNAICLDNNITDFSEHTIKEYFIKKRIIGKIDLLAKLMYNEYDKNEKDYIIQRYLYCAEVMSMFCNDPQAHAWIVLNMPKVKRGGDFDQTVLEKMWENIYGKKSYDKNKRHIVFLNSTGELYEKDLNKIKGRLENGDNLIVFAAYNSIMTGQNLDYYDKSYHSDTAIMNMNSNKNDTRYSKKDFDGIFLGDVTHVDIKSIFSKDTDADNEITEEEKTHIIIDYCERLHEKNLLNYPQMKNLIKMVLRQPYDKKINNISYLTRIQEVSNFVPNQGLYYIIQAVGRLGRSFRKNKSIKIMISKKNLQQYIIKEELQNRNLIPEMQCLFNIAKEQRNMSKEDEYIQISKIASNNSCKGKKKLDAFLRRVWNGSIGWTEEEMILWREERKNSLKYPTATKEELSMLMNRTNNLASYITSREKINKYMFFRLNDFSYIDILFDMNKDNFLQKEEFQNLVMECKDNIHSELYFSTVSAAASHLEIIMKVSNMREHFEDMGYATEWEAKEYIISPAYFNNIYKGAIGEICGNFIKFVKNTRDFSREMNWRK